MKALLLKELREVLRVTLLWVATFALAVVLVGLARNPGDWYWFLTGVWLWLMPLFGLWLGAQALSRDRAQRQLEWQGRWPASRLQWWAAKVLVHLGALIAAFVATWAVLRVGGIALGWVPEPGEPTHGEFPAMVVLALGAALLLFGLAALVAGNARGPMEGVGISVLLGGAIGFGGYVAVSDFLPARFGPRLGLSAENLPPLQLLTFALVFMLVCLAGSAAAVWRMPLYEFRRRILASVLVTLVAMAVALPALVGFWIHCPLPQYLGATSFDGAMLSPDRTLVAFEDDGSRLLQRPRIWVLNLTDKRLHCVARGSTGSYMWRPGTRQLLVEYGTMGVTSQSWGWLIEADGRHPRRLPCEGSVQSLSPGGRYVVVHQGYRRFASVDLQQQQVAAWPVTRADPDGMAYARTMGWAPDESGFFALRDDGSVDLYRVADQSVRPLVIGDRGPHTYLRGHWLARKAETAPTPPDLQSRLIGTTFTDLQNGSAFTVPRLAPLPSREWLSPDGRTALLTDNHRLALLDMTTHAVRTVVLPIGPGQESRTALWSPDGSQVAVRRDDMSPQTYSRLYRLNTQGPPRLREWAVLPWNTTPIGWLDNESLLLRTDQTLTRLDLSGLQQVLFEAPARGR